MSESSATTWKTAIYAKQEIPEDSFSAPNVALNSG